MIRRYGAKDRQQQLARKVGRQDSSNREVREWTAPAGGQSDKMRLDHKEPAGNARGALAESQIPGR